MQHKQERQKFNTIVNADISYVSPSHLDRYTGAWTPVEEELTYDITDQNISPKYKHAV